MLIVRLWSVCAVLLSVLMTSPVMASKNSSIRSRAKAENELFTKSKKGLWTPPEANENCLITTTARYKSGEVKKEVFSLRAKNKADCEWSRKTFNENFDPVRVKKVEARMTWRGQ